MFGKDVHPNEGCETGDVEQIRRVDVHRRVQRSCTARLITSMIAALLKQCVLKQGADGNVRKQTGKYSIFFVIHNKQIRRHFFERRKCR